MQILKGSKTTMGSTQTVKEMKTPHEDSTMNLLQERQEGTSNRRSIRQAEERHTDNIKQFLEHLVTVEPEGLHVVSDGAWEEITMFVDSGATESVVPEDMLESIETKEGPAAKRGVQYEVANGIRIPNLGEKSSQAHTEDGAVRSITAQVCDVNKALLSVSRMVKAGHRVVFDEESRVFALKYYEYNDETRDELKARVEEELAIN